MLRLLDRGLTLVCITATALVVTLLFVGPSLVGAKKKGTGKYGTTAASGAQVFKSAQCGNCHTLKAASASGAVGPNLDDLRPSADTVSAIVRSGGGGMPSFVNKLNDAQIAAVARYVSTVAGR
ncbi:MAG TPA: cytochrome c [Thermoleophilaceae bacterium]